MMMNYNDHKHVIVHFYCNPVSFHVKTAGVLKDICYKELNVRKWKGF